MVCDANPYLAQMDDSLKKFENLWTVLEIKQEFDIVDYINILRDLHVLYKRILCVRC